jgi:predicted acetyltransferase
MKELRLVEPSEVYKDSYMEMYEEWKRSGEEFTPWSLGLDPSDFPALIERLQGYSEGIDVPSNFVESSTYWLIDESLRVLGGVNIRHRLNENLSARGGHIGYGIRPSERRKGYASEQLRLALDIMLEMGITQVLITCDTDNPGSARAILKNGGVLDSEAIDGETGKPFRRYWIHLL